MGDGTRVERDSMGEVRVPEGAYFGAQTQRAIENFPVSGEPMPLPVARAVAMIKGVAARVNADLGLIPQIHAAAVAEAAREESAVISCGGGVVTRPGNLKRLKAEGVQVCR